MAPATTRKLVRISINDIPLHDELGHDDGEHKRNERDHEGQIEVERRIPVNGPDRDHSRQIDRERVEGGRPIERGGADDDSVGAKYKRQAEQYQRDRKRPREHHSVTSKSRSSKSSFASRTASTSFKSRQWIKISLRSALISIGTAPGVKVSMWVRAVMVPSVLSRRGKATTPGRLPGLGAMAMRATKMPESTICHKNSAINLKRLTTRRR